MFNKIKNFFGRKHTETWVNIPDKKAWEFPELMTYLREYPNTSSMKNSKVLEILQDNRKLTKNVQILSYTKKYSDQSRREEIKELLDTIFGMSRQNGVLESYEYVYRIVNRHGFEVTEDGFVIEKGEN